MWWSLTWTELGLTISFLFFCLLTGFLVGIPWLGLMWSGFQLSLWHSWIAFLDDGFLLWYYSDYSCFFWSSFIVDVSSRPTFRNILRSVGCEFLRIHFLFSCWTLRFPFFPVFICCNMFGLWWQADLWFLGPLCLLSVSFLFPFPLYFSFLRIIGFQDNSP